MLKGWRTLLMVLGAAGALGGQALAGQYAIFETSAGDFTCELYPGKAPKTVENFVGLAKGTKEWTNPTTHEKVKGKPLYDGTIFHRTIPGFMIQGGDPLGLGIGGPGYKFEDESSDLTFDVPGYLAMANAGPNTNGSQFFVTVVPTPHLNGRHTIFGKVLKGMDVVNKIVNMPTGPQNRPINPVTIKTIKIVDQLPGSGAPATSGTETAKSDKPTTK